MRWCDTKKASVHKCSHVLNKYLQYNRSPTTKLGHVETLRMWTDLLKL